MNQSREAHHPAWPLHSPEGGHDQGEPAAQAVMGYADGRRRDSRRGAVLSWPGEQHRRWAGQAAKLASEAARAEGASSPPLTVAEGGKWQRPSHGSP
jgi:hypothetical protein